jgi:hypothetical protein
MTRIWGLMPDNWESPVAPWEALSPERKRVVAQAWQTGVLEWKLNPDQRVVYRTTRKWQATPDAGRVFVWDMSRRYGKSTLELLMAFEDAIRNRRWRIPYVAPTYKMVEEILIPLIAELTQDCPPHIWSMKNYERSKTTLHFPQSGSAIKLVGLDVNPDGARGQWLDQCYGDECGFFDNFEYVLKSVLFPQMQKKTHARVVLGSTPPVSPAHYWSSVIVPEAIASGNYLKRTIEDNPMLSKRERDEFIELAGGRKAVACRREYFAEHIADSTLAIVPEFRDKEARLVRAVDPPRWRDCYVSLDPGWKDLTALLFGYAHFEQRKLVIEDEVAMPMANSDDIAAATKQKEAQLWGGLARYSRSSSDGTRSQPYLRVSDVKPETISDLWQHHGLLFTPTRKDNLDDQVNAVRVAVQQERIVIHPRCVKLIAQLRNAVWRNEARKVFSNDSAFGHFDLVAALIYLWRNINWARNPYPPGDRYVAGLKQEKTAKELGFGNLGESKWKPRAAARWRAGDRVKWRA